MATYTTNYHLKKPGGEDNVLIEDLNDNFDIIDTKIKEAADSAPEVATTRKAGVVKPDGTTITVEEDGTIHGAQNVPIATTQQAGIVKPDGTSVTVDQDGTIHGAIPVASTATLGGIRVGNNLSIDQNGILSSRGGANYYTITTAPHWLASVATYNDIATTYPSPSVEDAVLCEDTGRAYYYNGTAWVLISTNVYPEYTYAETLAILEAD